MVTLVLVDVGPVEDHRRWIGVDVVLQNTNTNASPWFSPSAARQQNTSENERHQADTILNWGQGGTTYLD